MSIFCGLADVNAPQTTLPEKTSSPPDRRSVRDVAEKIATQVLMKPENSAAVWDRIFEQEPPSAEQLIEVIEYLHDRKHYEVAVEGLLSAIRNDLAGPWTYDVLAPEMKLAGRPNKEIARVLSSRVDFATSDVPQMLITAAMLSRIEAWDEANALLREAAELNPEFTEVWMLGRSVADKSSSVDARVETRCGILNYVWSEGYERHHEEARKVLSEIASRHDRDGKSNLAEEVRRKLSDAAAVDLQIVLKWVGSADLDLIVTEPGGAQCSERNRLTENRGRLIRVDGNGIAAELQASRKCSEHYVIDTAPSGTYDIAVRFVLGKAVTGTAVIEVIQHAGTTEEIRTTKMITLGRDDARLSTVLSRGRADSK